MGFLFYRGEGLGFRPDCSLKRASERSARIPVAPEITATRPREWTHGHAGIALDLTSDLMFRSCNALRFLGFSRLPIADLPNDCALPDAGTLFALGSVRALRIR